MAELLRDDFDSPWKDLLEKYFQQFMEFFCNFSIKPGKDDFFENCRF